MRLTLKDFKINSAVKNREVMLARTDVARWGEIH